MALPLQRLDVGRGPQAARLRAQLLPGAALLGRSRRRMQVAVEAYGVAAAAAAGGSCRRAAHAGTAPVAARHGQAA